MIVVDQNCLNAPEVTDNLRASPDYKVGLSASFLLETFIKPEKWVFGARRSLTHFCGYARQVFVLEDSNVAIRREVDLGVTEGILVDRHNTKLVRGFIESLRQSTDDQLESVFGSVFRNKRDAISRNRLNAADAKEVASWNAGAFALSLKHEAKEALRGRLSGRRPLLQRDLALFIPIHVLLCKSVYGINLAKALSLGENSVAFGRSALSCWYYLHGGVNGGIEGKSEEKVLNDYLDIEIALAASHQTSLITKDKRMRIAYEALVRVRGLLEETPGLFGHCVQFFWDR